MSWLYKWLIAAGGAIIAGLTIWAQRNIIKRQDEQIKDGEKIIEVKTAVHEVNKQSEIKAREYVKNVTKDNASKRNYLITGKLRNDKD